MKRTARLFLAALGLALALGGVPRAYAGTVLVQSILEGRSTDATSAGDLVLLVVGKGLKSVDFLHLEPAAGFEGLLPTVDLRSPWEGLLHRRARRIHDVRGLERHDRDSQRHGQPC